MSNNDKLEKYFFYCDDYCEEIRYGYLYDVETTTSKLFPGKKKSNYLVARELQGVTCIDDFNSLDKVRKDMDAVIAVIERKLLMYNKYRDEKYLKDINQDFDLYRYLDEDGEYYGSYYFCNFICSLSESIMIRKQKIVNSIAKVMGWDQDAD